MDVLSSFGSLDALIAGVAQEEQRVERQFNMCDRKNGYPSKRDAQTYINLFNRTKRGRHGNADSLRTYHCPHCNLWHLTKSEA